jgi:hypothetical protein
MCESWTKKTAYYNCEIIRYMSEPSVRSIDRLDSGKLSCESRQRLGLSLRGRSGTFAAP